jgi:hypothetical protein
MRISVRGWGRDAGETEVMDGALADAEAVPPNRRLTRGTLYKEVEYPETKWRTKVRIVTSADLRLGGNYMLRVELSRKEIAELFFDTHKGAMIRMIQSFVEEEEREDRARQLTRLAEYDDRRRKRHDEAWRAAHEEPNE